MGNGSPGNRETLCMGVTEEGYKKVLGFTQATTERAEPVRELLRDLIGRGLSFDNGILCVIDGSKGLRKAIGEVFGDRAEVQRCRWHKRKNVVSYLPKADQKTWRTRLQRAYQETTYEAAKERLTSLHAELQQVNRKAARSLQEGLEETLTLHRLGLFDELGKSLSGHQLHREPHGRCWKIHRRRKALASLPSAAPVDGPGGLGSRGWIPATGWLRRSSETTSRLGRGDSRRGMTRQEELLLRSFQLDLHLRRPPANLAPLGQLRGIPGPPARRGGLCPGPGEAPVELAAEPGPAVRSGGRGCLAEIRIIPCASGPQCGGARRRQRVDQSRTPSFRGGDDRRAPRSRHRRPSDVIVRSFLGHLPLLIFTSDTSGRSS